MIGSGVHPYHILQVYTYVLVQSLLLGFLYETVVSKTEVFQQIFNVNVLLPSNLNLDLVLKEEIKLIFNQSWKQ